MSQSRKSGKVLLVLVVLTAVIAAAGWWFLTKKGRVPPKVQTVVVQRGSIVQAVTATGQLEPVLQTDVSSQISGRIVDVRVDYNTPVKKGDVLARIDPATYESAVLQAENEILNAKANLKLMQANAGRTRTLYDKALVSQAEHDSVMAQLEQAEVQIRIREAALESRKTDLSRCTIYAPIDGIVIDRLAEVGKTVAASLNAPTLFTIVNDLSKMQINAAVAEADIGNVKEGQAVDFTVDAYPDEKFTGRVSQVRNLPVTQQNVVVYAVIIDVSNEHLKLKPGMTANVSVIIQRRDEALRLPNAALRARIPESLLPPTPPAAAAKPGEQPAPAAPPLKVATREEIWPLMREAGFQPGGGPPSAEVIARVRELAAAKGLQLPDDFGSGRRGGGGGGGAPGAVTTRTVYRLIQELPELKIEAVTVKVGITDGIATEVIDGLKADDVIVTSVTLADGSSGSGASNPFGGGFRRF